MFHIDILSEQDLPEPQLFGSNSNEKETKVGSRAGYLSSQNLSSLFSSLSDPAQNPRKNPPPPYVKIIPAKNRQRKAKAKK